MVERHAVEQQHAVDDRTLLLAVEYEAGGRDRAEIPQLRQPQRGITFRHGEATLRAQRVYADLLLRGLGNLGTVRLVVLQRPYVAPALGHNGLRR